MDIPPAENVASKPSIVTSGESDGNEESSDEENVDSGRNNGNHADDHHDILRLSNQQNEDLFYDEHADADDEAYVYKNLRSGQLENINFIRKKNNDDESKNHNPLQQQQRQQNVEQMKVLKPRHSDAVLSCPCCFNVVCMDCQRHYRYPDQYRAMFVMGITVKWDEQLRYDKISQSLVQFHSQPPAAVAASSSTSNVVPPDSTTHGQHHHRQDNDVVKKGEEADFYYKVCCANCETQVAALDMTDEVYHFYGCLASS